jgi:serine/threonine-protein kinase
MEYVAGQTLKNMIPPGGLSFDQVADLGSQVALALGAAHAAGIVHRDIKPANILVTPQQQVKVVDFEIARLQRDTNETQLTIQGEVVGTVAYMSPEQTRGEDAVAAPTFFRWGVCSHEAATGRLPFNGPNIARYHARNRHRIGASELRPSRSPTGVHDRLVARCLAKMPAERPESAVELATELKSLTFPGSAQPKVRMALPSLAAIPPLVRGPETEQ